MQPQILLIYYWVEYCIPN